MGSGGGGAAAASAPGSEIRRDAPRYASAPGSPLLAVERILAIQDELLADDVSVDLEQMRTWSEEEVSEYFESGGARSPSPKIGGGAATGGWAACAAGGEAVGAAQADESTAEHGDPNMEDVLIVPLHSWYDYRCDAPRAPAVAASCLAFLPVPWPAPRLAAVPLLLQQGREGWGLLPIL